MTFANTIRVDQHLLRARLLADGETVEVMLFQAARSATPAAGWAVTVAGSAVAISAGEIDDDGLVLLTIPATTGDQAVKISYDQTTGSILGDDFELAAFTNRAVANFSEYVVPTPGPTGYPLDDDGTLATAFGFAHAETTAPDYLQADYTYTGTADGGTAVALPQAANWLTDQAIVVGAGTILGIEVEVIDVSDTPFGLLGLAAALSTDGVFGNVVVTNGIDDDGDNGPRWRGTGIADQTRMQTTAGFRLGMEINGDDGTITILSSDGSVLSSATFTPGTAFTAYLFLSDSGIPDAGQTAGLRLIQSGGDYTLPFTVGAVDLLGDEI